MDKQSIPPKFMRPRVYAQRIGVNWRTLYAYLSAGVLPSYKFQGVLLVDIDEADAIVKGLVRRVPPPIKRPAKAGRPRKPLEPAAVQ